ncbi:MAG: LysR substrate-binding domain-containing protein [Burkholderiales bacterium]|jgi:DNA-binding transcriptional LysR family regulator|nr:LysR substrate-binding domain-containing protein [Burkholderiales bacterium]
MRFTFRQLEYFVAAGTSGSVKLASEAVSISQPAVSAAIHHLEDHFGVQLFVRHHAQGLSLTPAGERLLREAKALLAHAEAFSGVALELANDLGGPLAVGCLVTLAPLLVPTLHAAFAVEHPRVRLDVTEDHHAGLLDGLRAGRLSVALTYDLATADDVAFEPLAALAPAVLLRADHPLARRASLALRDLGPLPLLLLDLPLSREYFLGLFAQDGLEPAIGARSPQPDVLRALVAAGQGFGLVNVRPVGASAPDGTALVCVPLAAHYRPMTVGLATVKGLHRTRLLARFEQWCRDTLPTLVEPRAAAPRRRARR